MRRIYRWPVNSPHNWPATWKMFPFDDVIMNVFWAHGLNLAITPLVVNMNLITMRQTLKHATTDQLSWHVHNCELIWPLLMVEKQHEIFQDLSLGSQSLCETDPWVEIHYESQDCPLIAAHTLLLSLSNKGAHHIISTILDTTLLVYVTTGGRAGGGVIVSILRCHLISIGTPCCYR